VEFSSAQLLGEENGVQAEELRLVFAADAGERWPLAVDSFPYDTVHLIRDHYSVYLLKGAKQTRRGLMRLSSLAHG
jgi:hypothetical protein